MANEFIHIDPGAILTKAEFELITGHQFNSQATGDILYASDSTQLSRLGIGSNTNVLEITGGVPAWVASSGTGSVARVTSPTFVTPALGTPSALVGTNISGTASSLTAGTVTTNANLTGHVTSSGNAAVLGSFTSAQLATALTNETGSGLAVFATSPTLVTPALGTPASGVLTNATGLPTAGIVNDAVTLAKMAGITRGSIIYGNASGDPAALAKGSADYVLTSDGTDIAWASAAGGGSGNLVLIGTVEASTSASLTITGLDSTYDTFLILVADLIPSNDNRVPEMQVGDSSGIDTGATDYSYHLARPADSSAAYDAQVSTGAPQMNIGSNTGNAAGEGCSATIWLGRPGDGTMVPTFHGTWSSVTHSGVLYGGTLAGRRKAVITLDRILIKLNAGNIATGRLTVYGVKHD